MDLFDGAAGPACVAVLDVTMTADEYQREVLAEHQSQQVPDEPAEDLG